MSKSKVRIKNKVLKKLKESKGRKIKTKKAAAKRFKVTGNGNIKINHATKKHNTGHKRRSLKNQLRRGLLINDVDFSRAKRCLPNSF